ncbi:hypothetical protein BpHYR1_016618 [Brachionus plicatilis]|uniref:Uncharacterized protein n=1 Tax=Brachionus plicatilis TaxID=10195 RepID=A0A3M7SKY2_BRAPC|nr:hypothetical protein BpHYR1_016618 [Brachionus plicatilis]
MKEYVKNDSLVISTLLFNEFINDRNRMNQNTGFDLKSEKQKNFTLHKINDSKQLAAKTLENSKTNKIFFASFLFNNLYFFADQF